MQKIQEIMIAERIEKVILGEPLNYRNGPNIISSEVEEFKQELARIVPVEYESEVLTSKEAERLAGRDEYYDARAAALILKSYIDRTAK